MLGYRIIHGVSLLVPRSFCPQCHSILHWYDLIPVISWLVLRAQCRSCKTAISFLYPAIELLTALVFTLMIMLIDPAYWLAYSIFFSALLITIRTDFETMLISRAVTLYIIPIAFIASIYNLLPITVQESVAGALLGYILLWSIAKLFYILRKKEGMGEGDFELLALIGSFTGITGVWYSLFLGAFMGSLIGIIIILTQKKSLHDAKIPFGPYLAMGSLLYIFAYRLISDRLLLFL